MSKTATKSTIERRAVKGIEVRASDGDESSYIGTLEGYAAVFNRDSEEFDKLYYPWVERIAPGAFTRTLKELPDVRCLWSHRSDVILARAGDTLQLLEDSAGLKVVINLIDTQANRDLLANVRAGLVDSMSFGFKAKKEQWEEGAGRDIRTLIDVDLYEVSPVVWPAYPDTDLAARSHETFRQELQQRQAVTNLTPQRDLWERRLRLHQ